MVLALMLAAIFAPSNSIISKSIIINAPVQKVFPQLIRVKSWKKWDPWFSKDSTQRRTYFGNLSDANSGLRWTSNYLRLREGTLFIDSFLLNSTIDFSLEVKNDILNSRGIGSFNLIEDENNTSVTWKLESNLLYPKKILNYFFENLLEKDLEIGLGRLKYYVESGSYAVEEKAKDEIQITTEFDVNYAILKAKNITPNGLDGFFLSAYKTLYGYTQTNGLSAKGPARALFYSWSNDISKKKVAAAIPISNILEETGDSVAIEVGKGFLTESNISYYHRGKYSLNKSSHLALSNWVKDNNKEIVYPIVEEYIVGPSQTEDSNKFETKIIYHIQ